MRRSIVQLFILNNAAITADVREVLGVLNVSVAKSEVERATDKLVEEHIQQIDYEIRNNAEKGQNSTKFFICLKMTFGFLLKKLFRAQRELTGGTQQFHKRFGRMLKRTVIVSPMRGWLLALQR
jgi:hypothetical protein